MRSVVLDSQGHLTQFTLVTPQVDETQTPAPAMDWHPLFDAAGLDMNTFTPADSTWVPNSYADERKAWEGPMPGRPDIRLRVEAASYRGRAAFFQIVGPWSRRLRQDQPQQDGQNVLRFGLFLIVLALSIGTCVLARHNVRTGRGDRRGATRIALALLTILFFSWLLGARHSLQPLTEYRKFLDFAADQLLYVAILWLVYLALEPYVRRYSPDMLMSWTRLISGRFRDPRVGRDILVGIAAGIVVALIRCALVLVPPLFGSAPPPPRSMNTEFLLTTRHAISALLQMPPNALFNGMLITLAYALARMLVKSTWVAAAIAGVLLAFVVVSEAGTEQLALNILFAAAVSLVYMVVLVYFGMFTQMIAFLTNFILGQSGLTADLSKLYAPTSIWMLALITAMAAFGYYASRAGEPLFGKLSES
ncbi:MAG TPA: hypothetical protein VLV86_07175, partial [Vicinamibacterales bacterium]|nr:hypothetical protein [Vicinamibacterales bacterium]